MIRPEEIFFTTIGCMDGRSRDAVVRYGREKFGAQFADTITEAGLVEMIAENDATSTWFERLKFKIVDISLGQHSSRGIVVYGHAECAGDPVDDELQKKHVRESVEFIKRLIKNSVPVVGAFIVRDSQNATVWKALEVEG